MELKINIDKIDDDFFHVDSDDDTWVGINKDVDEIESLIKNTLCPCYGLTEEFIIYLILKDMGFVDDYKQ